MTGAEAPGESAISARWAKRVIRRFDNRGTGVGFLAAFLALLCVNLPLLNVEGDMICWWTMIGAPGGARFVFLCAYMVVAALVVFVAAVKARGAVRGTVFLCAAAGAAGVLGWLAAASAAPAEALLFYASWVLVPALALAIAVAAEHRSIAPWAGSGRAFLGGASALALLAVGIVAAQIVKEVRLAVGSGAAVGSPPVPVFVVLVLFAAGYLDCAGAAVLGLLGARSAFSRRLTVATGVAALVAAGLVAAAVTSAACAAGAWLEMAEMGGLPLPVHFTGRTAGYVVVPPGPLVLILLRVIVVTYSFVTLAAAGLGEVLAARRLGPLARAGESAAVGQARSSSAEAGELPVVVSETEAAEDAWTSEGSEQAPDTIDGWDASDAGPRGSQQ